MLENVLALFKHFPEFNAALGAGLLIFTRLLGFIVSAPILSRKDVPMLVKVGLAVILTTIFVSLLHPGPPPAGFPVTLGIVLNFVFGMLIGYIASVIFATIGAAGDMINMQMGLSASMIFDPNTREQVSIMGKLFSFLATLIFIHIGGLYWLVEAFQRGFDIFPIYGLSIPLDHIINVKYLILLTGNVLLIGLQVAAPVLLATLAMDVILGIISKTAPQINVFQISFLFKPVLGFAIMVIVLPMLMDIITDYFTYYSKLYQ